MPAVGAAEAENPPAGRLGLARSLPLGQLQVFQMASPGSVCLHRQLLFTSQRHPSPRQTHGERPGTPRAVAGGVLMEMAFQGTFLLKRGTDETTLLWKTVKAKGNWTT